MHEQLRIFDGPARIGEWTRGSELQESLRRQNVEDRAQSIGKRVLRSLLTGEEEQVLDVPPMLRQSIEE